MVTGKMARSLSLHPSCRRRVRWFGGKPASEADAIHFLDHVFQKSLLLLIFISMSESPLVTWLSRGPLKLGSPKGFPRRSRWPPRHPTGSFQKRGSAPSLG